LPFEPRKLAVHERQPGQRPVMHVQRTELTKSRVSAMADKRALVRCVSAIDPGWRLPIRADGVMRRLLGIEQTLGNWG
jgi:hypothetical protein